MKDEISPERLLVASGVQKAKTPMEELLDARNKINDSVGKLLTRADEALSAAQKTQRTTDEMFHKLEKFCSEKMPAQMVNAINAVAQEGVQKGIAPLNASVAEAVRDIEKCRGTLTHLPWNWRLLTVAGAVGLAVGLMGGAIGGGLVFHFFYSPKNVELHRLAWWGRNLQARMSKTPVKDQDRINRWLNGEKLGDVPGAGPSPPPSTRSGNRRKN